MSNNNVKSIECARCDSNRTYGKLPVRNKRNIRTKRTKKRKRNNSLNSSDSGFDEIIIDRKTKKNLNNLNSLNKKKLKDIIHELRSIIEENNKYIFLLKRNDSENKQQIYELEEEIKTLRLRIIELKNLLGMRPTKKRRFNNRVKVDPYDKKRPSNFNIPNVVDPREINNLLKNNISSSSLDSLSSNSSSNRLNDSRSINLDSSDSSSSDLSSSDSDSSNNNTFATVGNLLKDIDSSSEMSSSPETSTITSSESRSNSSENSSYNADISSFEPERSSLLDLSSSPETSSLLNSSLKSEISILPEATIQNLINGILKTSKQKKQTILKLLNDKKVFDKLKY
jgi:hypothetical protein